MLKKRKSSGIFVIFAKILGFFSKFYFFYHWQPILINFQGFFKAKKQISPLSGSIKEQVVTFIGKEKIIINNKEYFTDHFKIKSKNENLSDDKKLDFDVWYNSENNIILKVSYSKMGNWEYRLKNFK